MQIKIFGAKKMKHDFFNDSSHISNSNQQFTYLSDGNSPHKFNTNRGDIVTDKSAIYLRNILDSEESRESIIKTVRIDNFTLKMEVSNSSVGFKDVNEFYKIIKLFSGCHTKIKSINKDELLITVRVDIPNHQDYFEYELTLYRNEIYFVYVPKHINLKYLDEEEQVFGRELEIHKDDLEKLLDVFKGH